ncbi:hypothetical protein F8O01_00260 [Pseudoclavibacter chungangensis]|uniref:Uncharacterized protein n=1 Tax=Pseudoclavibacter chungangensis TaxID=587635 RepID=A0A7J5C2K8_9MICO|nr:hypothetical protein [Pseudoclavibacter chungangensis]KAB1662422.1 hypothetical protein F8O01_00260 [Pseudoclavibacter chungangensis]NYJ68450.1 hypothetical protein [Pseudoclavibacter chungangensis]
MPDVPSTSAERLDGATPMTTPMPAIRHSIRRLPAAVDEPYVSVPTSYALACAPRGGRFAFLAVLLGVAAVLLAFEPVPVLLAVVPWVCSIAFAAVAIRRRTRRTALVVTALSLAAVAVGIAVIDHLF